jgi:hypothetical protein
MGMMPWDGIVGLVDTVITRVFPDKTEAQRAELQIALEQMKAEYDLAKGQMEVNAIEAASSDRFVSGWRPFIGWVCGVSFAYKYIAYPFIMFICALSEAKIDVSTIPVIDASEMTPVLMGMLGLGTMRTYEKYKGVNK